MKLSLQALALAFALAGCLTYAQVKEIVDASNAEATARMEAAVLDGDLSLTDGGKDSALEATARRAEQIDAFIAAHPDQPRLNASLRVRQALGFFQAGQPALARLAFEQVDGSALASERDRALFGARDALLWWAGRGQKASLTSDDDRDGAAALLRVDESCGTPPSRSDACRFLERLRIKIALRLATARPDPKPVLGKALERYASQFDAADWQAIERWHCAADAAAAAADGAAADASVLRRARWYDFVTIAYAEARTVCDDGDVEVARACGVAIPEQARKALACDPR
jgi:hypothetical protein